MDNLRKSIEVIFNHSCPDTIIQNLYDTNPISSELDSHAFSRQAVDIFSNYSFNEIENVYQKLQDDWMKDIHQNKQNENSIFNLLTHFNNQVLCEQDNEPFVKFEHLLRWRALSYKLGEDIFTCAYFAYMDNRISRNRDCFAWRTVAFSDNYQLKTLLDRGVAENHFHLRGSAPIFDISWICLMNNINSHSDAFNKLKETRRLSGLYISSFKQKTKSIDILCYKAALIRLHLCRFLNNDEPIDLNKLKLYIQPSSNDKDSFYIESELSNIQLSINNYKKIEAITISHNRNEVALDYAIPKVLDPQNDKGAIVAIGERILLYGAFKYIYAQKKDFKVLEQIIHAYLSIKNEFRSELIQVNENVGFENFSLYQDRKEWFIPKDSIYQKALLNMAINDSVKFQTLKSFEVRIPPQDTPTKLKASLEEFSLATEETAFTLNRNTYLEGKIKHIESSLKRSCLKSSNIIK